MSPRRRSPRPSRVRHAFELAATSRDWRDQTVQYCRCGLPGEPGDDRHPADADPLPPVPEEARQIDARVLGERST